MAKSMTGFGRGRAANEQMAVTVEMKSLNNRYCDINVRLPHFFNSLEPQLRTQCRTFVQRGKLDCAVTVEFAAELERKVAVDLPLATAYDRALKDLARELSAQQETDIAYLAALPDVMTLGDYQLDLEAAAGLLEQATTEALTHLLEMRRGEGAHLTADILSGCRELLSLSQQLAGLADEAPELCRKRLTERLQRFFDHADALALTEERLAMEVALLADKADVHEELVRLEKHLTDMLKLVQEDRPVGKNLDFYCQEVNREINTIGSKANDGDMTYHVIKMKTVLETVREQVQNLE